MSIFYVSALWLVYILLRNHQTCTLILAKRACIEVGKPSQHMTENWTDNASGLMLDDKRIRLLEESQRISAKTCVQVAWKLSTCLSYFLAEQTLVEMQIKFFNVKFVKLCISSFFNLLFFFNKFMFKNFDGFCNKTLFFFCVISLK